jgi:uncharacterized protein (DUF1499 family)
LRIERVGKDARMKTRVLLIAALTLSLATPLYFMTAALGVKFGLWPWRFGLGTLIVEWGPRLLGIALLLAIVALVAVLIRRPRHGVLLAVVALLIPALGLAHLYQLRARSQAIPPIHDVATNVEDPPAHSPRLAAARAAADSNPVHPLTDRLSAIEAYRTPRFADQANRTVGELGREAYPQLRPLTVAADRRRLFDVLTSEAQERGWTIVTSDPAAGRLEATAETFWFGFKDDVAVRVRPAAAPGRFVIDARSTSRVGLSDLGANAARLTDYLQAVEDKLRAEN